MPFKTLIMQQLQFYAVVIGISLLLGSLLVFVLMTIARLQQRKKTYLHKLNILAQVTAQEKDRARVTYNLHEEFGATLSAVKMGMSGFDLADPEQEVQREQLKQYLDDVVNKIRNIAFDFLPYTVQRKKLAMAIEGLVRSTNQLHHDLVISLTIEEDLPEVSEHKTVNIYRVLQEIINNTIQHSNASTLFISVKKEEDFILISTCDYGDGFNYVQELEGEKGLGLNGMLNRILLLNGSLEADTQKGGTLYHIKIPA